MDLLAGIVRNTDYLSEKMWKMNADTQFAYLDANLPRGVRQ
jgi:hypothetical protein